MKNSQYRWTESSKSQSPVKICITDCPLPMKPHSQNELELMYFYHTDGCKYRLGGRELLFVSGELAAVNPGELHSCNDWGNGCRAACVIINLKRLPASALSELVFERKNPRCAETDEIFSELDRLLSTEKSGCSLDCNVLSLICHLLAILCEKAVPKSMLDERLDTVLEHIKENYSESIRLCDLAALAHLSEDRFYHVFREQTGMSPTEYILAERIFRACSLLKETNMKITAIAVECGFCSPSYFSKKFREYMNMPPAEYRRKCKNGDEFHS